MNSQQHTAMKLLNVCHVVCLLSSGVEAPTAAMNCLRFELARWVQNETHDAHDQGSITVPPVRLLSACEWLKESQLEILAMKPEIMSGLPGPPSDEHGCLFSDINATHAVS